jgi:hypothetical protein
MKKTIAATALALTLAGTGFALAQSAAPQTAQAPRFNAEDAAAFTDARIAGLKAGLKLTPEQEKNWPSVETAIRDLAKQRADRVNARGDARRSGDNAAPAPDAIARLRDGATAMTTRADSLKKLADAAEPLYKSLDDSQKRRFAVLLRAGGRPALGDHRMHRMHRADNAR